MLNLILALICVAAGTAFLINYIKLTRRVKTILENGREIYAEIAEIPVSSEKDSDVRPVVEYEVDGEKKRITDLKVSKSLGVYAGQPLIVILDQTDGNSYLVKENIDSKKYMNVGGLLGGSEGIVWAVVSYVAAVMQLALVFMY